MLQMIFTDALHLVPSGDEIFRGVVDLSRTDKSIIAVTLMWFFLYWVPLSGVDHREWLTGITYILFLVSSGVVLASLDSDHLLGPYDFRKTTTLMVILSILGGLRWMFFYYFSDKKKQSAKKAN